MAFPHPKSRKYKCRKEDKPNKGGVLWNFFERTIYITEYRNAKDDVNAAKNRTLGGITDHFIPFPLRVCCDETLTTLSRDLGAQRAAILLNGRPY